jgi:hypothetical protein
MPSAMPTRPMIPGTPTTNTGGVMDKWTIPVAGPGLHTPAAILASVIATADAAPHAYLMLTQPPNAPNDAGKMVLLHRVARFPAPFGQAIDAEVHDIVYAFVGDVTQGQAPQTVVMPPTAFHLLANACRVPTVDHADSWSNPTGTITNSDLELAGTIIEHEAIVQNWDVRERTVRVCTENTPTEAWQRKGSVTTTAAPAYLLRLQSIHQRFHRCGPRRSRF